MTFYISPGIGLNTAQVGYKINPKLVGFIGFQYATGSVGYTDKGQRYDSDLDKIVDYEDTYKSSGGIYLPNIGVKYFLVNKDKVSTYATICLTKPLVSAKIEESGEDTRTLKDEIDKYSAWGSELGFGAEYFFDKSFSIGGEFGIRYMRASFSQKYDDTIYDPDTNAGKTVEITDSYTASFNPTFSKISLNFYF